MTQETHPGKAALLGHPIHPILVTFPIAFLVGALATDLAFYFTHNPFWALGSLWLVGAGLLTGVLAAVFGLVDFVTADKARSVAAGWVHLFGNAVVLLIALASLLLRVRDPSEAVMPVGLTLSVIDALLLVGTGWYGGELVYRHRIGIPAERPATAEARAPRPGPAGRDVGGRPAPAG